MAITFDHSITTEISNIDAQDRIDVINYDGSAFTNVYTSKQSDFDYFTDNAVVDSAIYFGWEWEKWHNLKVNITTPLVADSITVVWEYLDYNGAWQTLSVIDNSNAFQNSGSQIVEFTPPLDWRYDSINGQRGSWIRCRITAITNIAEGGANSTIAPDGEDYAIQITGDETLNSIYAWTISEGLEIIKRAGSVFTFYCNFRLGDKDVTPTTFTMLAQTLQIGETDTSNTNKTRYANKFSLFANNTNTIWNMGSAEGEQGCTFIYNVSRTDKTPYNYNRATLNWYNSLIQKNYGGYGEGGMRYGLKTFVNCIFSPYNVFFLIGVSAGSSFTNCVVDIGTTGYWYIYTPNFSFDNIQLTAGRGILAQGCTFSNTTYGSKIFYCYSGSNYLIDCSIDDPFTQFSGNAIGYLQYTVNIDIIDENGNPITTNLEIKDVYNNVVYNGNSSIPQVITVFDRVDKVNKGYNPFTFTITKNGYKDVLLKDVEITEKKDWTISLKKIYIKDFNIIRN